MRRRDVRRRTPGVPPSGAADCDAAAAGARELPFRTVQKAAARRPKGRAAARHSRSRKTDALTALGRIPTLLRPMQRSLYRHGPGRNRCREQPEARLLAEALIIALGTIAACSVAWALYRWIEQRW